MTFQKVNFVIYFVFYIYKFYCKISLSQEKLWNFNSSCSSFSRILFIRLFLSRVGNRITDSNILIYRLEFRLITFPRLIAATGCSIERVFKLSPILETQHVFDVESLPLLLFGAREIEWFITYKVYIIDIIFLWRIDKDDVIECKLKFLTLLNPHVLKLLEICHEPVTNPSNSV